MAINRSDIKFFLTAIDPLVGQSYRDQSLGGYPSTTPALLDVVLHGAIGRADATVVLESTTGMLGTKMLMIGDELIQVSNVQNGTVAVTARGAAGTTARCHVAGEMVAAIRPLDLFNNQLDPQNLSQYRCIAVKNTSASETAYDMAFYLRYASHNPFCTVSMAVEIPHNDYWANAATSGDKKRIVDALLPDFYTDNAFKDATISVGSHVTTVQSYDAETKSIVLTDQRATAIAAGEAYIIYPGPAQRTLSGFIRPASGTDLVSSFEAPVMPEQAITLNVHGNRFNEAQLKPNDVAYIWFKRTLKKNAVRFDNNSVMLAVRYRTSI